VSRAPHAREARCDPGCPQVSDLESQYAARMNLTVFEPLKLERSWTLATYRSIGGYEVWERLLKEKPPRAPVIDAVKASGRCWLGHRLRPPSLRRRRRLHLR